MMTSCYCAPSSRPAPRPDGEMKAAQGQAVAGEQGQSPRATAAAMAVSLKCAWGRRFHGRTDGQRDRWAPRHAEHHCSTEKSHTATEPSALSAPLTSQGLIAGDGALPTRRSRSCWKSQPSTKPSTEPAARMGCAEQRHRGAH